MKTPEIAKCGPLGMPGWPPEDGWKYELEQGQAIRTFKGWLEPEDIEKPEGQPKAARSGQIGGKRNALRFAGQSALLSAHSSAKQLCDGSIKPGSMSASPRDTPLCKRSGASPSGVHTSTHCSSGQITHTRRAPNSRGCTRSLPERTQTTHQASNEEERHAHAGMDRRSRKA